MEWFKEDRIPSGTWPFFKVTRVALAEFEQSLETVIDLTEGNEAMTITGCVRAYRQAIIRRVIDLAQAAASCWNAGHLIGAIVCARSLLETIATFHSFLTSAEAAAQSKDWKKIERLVDAYAFASSSTGKTTKREEDDPPVIGKVVKAFAGETQPGSEAFWDQICDTAHPNGRRMMDYAGILGGDAFTARPSTDSEPVLFIAVYNALYSCCWLSNANENVEILLAIMRSGEPLPPGHHLMIAKRRNDDFVATITKNLRKARIGPSTTSR